MTEHDPQPSTIVCCGLTTLDLTQTVTAVPQPNEKIVASSSAMDVGGPAANAARTVSALGHRASLISMIGGGPFAGAAHRILQAEEVDVTDLAEGGPTSDPALSLVMITPGGERAVVSANAQGHEPAYPSASVLDGASVLLIDGHLPDVQIPLARQAQQQGIPVVLDAGSYKDGLETLLTVCDHVICSADFHFPSQPELTGTDLLVAIRQQGPEMAAQSHGEGPIDVVMGSSTFRIPVDAVADEDVVDSLGAGDVLHGAYAAALAEGRNPIEALVAASAAASISVRFPGALGWSHALRQE